MRTYRLTNAERTVYRHFAELALPRHTSYPIASVWSSSFGPDDLRAALSRSQGKARPLSLYVHVPFCERLCYYCACTKEIVPPARHRAEDPSNAFLSALESEVDRFIDVLGPGDVRQVHLGGGSPTFLNPSQLERLWRILAKRFAIAAEAEIAIEIDPRITTLDQLQSLRGLGFNRVSLGVQDFAPQVQRAVNRQQSFELVERVVNWCRELGFASVNFDLIYGLPFQNLNAMSETLDKTLRLSPDRVAFYRLAVIPEMFRWQNVVRDRDLPAGDLPLDLNLLAINRFLEAGYEFIGLDHFAKTNEPLATAHRDGSLRRSFQGMTTGDDLDILGFGPSAISQFDDAFAQNAKTVADWQAAVTKDFATVRGMFLSIDDRLRRAVVGQLYAYGRVDIRSIENQFGIRFDDYFADELERLKQLKDRGLVTRATDAIELEEPLGRLLVRVVAAVFDRYLPRRAFCEGLPATLASKVG
jgi:oxygen-independent coproporphyrinogen-3 oxidase